MLSIIFVIMAIVAVDMDLLFQAALKTLLMFTLGPRQLWWRVDEDESDRLFSAQIERDINLKRPSALLSGHLKPKLPKSSPPPSETDDPPYSSMYPERADLFDRPHTRPSRLCVSRPPPLYDESPTSDEISRIPSNIPRTKTARLTWWFALVAAHPDIDSTTTEGRRQLYDIVRARENRRKYHRGISTSTTTTIRLTKQTVQIPPKPAHIVTPEINSCEQDNVEKLADDLAEQPKGWCPSGAAIKALSG